MYSEFLSTKLVSALVAKSVAVPGAEGLNHLGESNATLESPEALQFVASVYKASRDQLKKVLKQRKADRTFIDGHTRAVSKYNSELKMEYLSEDYKTVLGLPDAEGRVVFGPLRKDYVKTGGDPIAPLPEHLKGPHVTLFGPPDTKDISMDAMNCFHRKGPNEAPIVEELVGRSTFDPKWGADNEDSKTPLRAELAAAEQNLRECYDRTLTVDGKAMEKDRLALPIKRIPGLALPCTFLFQGEEPIPLHLYDFALHLFHCWQQPAALTFYVPKLENEEEAAYVKHFITVAEQLVKDAHPEYVLGTVRIIVVVENPRAIYRVHEIIDALYPHFAGCSLGWHDYLASAARLFREDPNYQIPVKADPNIVVQRILASHKLLVDVVGARGGIKIGGMYGVLPTDENPSSPSYQVTLKGFIRDACIQLKRNLDGFWVAHPDFVRLGIACVEAWKLREAGDAKPLEQLIRAVLLSTADQEDLLTQINAKDIECLDVDSALYARSLIVADIKESTCIANNDPEEVRYNVFQTLQYFADWMCGNGCVGLPANIGGSPVLVMDDLATCERSRWEVWIEIYHGRFPLEDFLRIAQEEMMFIRKDLSNEKKIVHVKYNAKTEKWYPVALNLMIRLCTDPEPVEFVTEYLLPFTIPEVRDAADPWAAAQAIDPVKFKSRFQSEKSY